MDSRPSPQDLDAEKSLLSAFFLAGPEVGAICVNEALTEASFFDTRNGVIFRHQMQAWADGDPVEFFLIQSRIRDSQQLELAGGSNYLMDVHVFNPSASTAGHFAAIIRDKHSLRRALAEARRAVELVFNSKQASATISEIQDAFLAITAKRKERRKTLKEHISGSVERIAAGQNATADIKTGLRELDAVVRMRRGNVVIVSGATKSGKTALLGNIITNAAVRQTRRVVLFSLEMSDEEQVDRFLSSEGKVCVSTLPANPTESEMSRLMRAVGQLTNADIVLVSDASTWAEIVATTRQLQAQKPIDLICIDYLQLVQGEGDNREQEVAGVSRGFKGLCSQIGCVGIGLSQLNDQGKMRDSRAIGHDANAVLCVEETEEGGRAIRVAMQRSGAMGMAIPVQWHPQWTKFEDA